MILIPQDVPDMLWSDVVQRLKFLLNVPNVVHFVRITLLVFLTTGMGLIVAVKSLAKFSLKVFRELSLIVHSSTPFLLGTSMNVLSKIFGGILILLSMVLISFILFCFYKHTANYFSPANLNN